MARVCCVLGVSVSIHLSSQYPSESPYEYPVQRKNFMSWMVLSIDLTAFVGTPKASRIMDSIGCAMRS